MNLTTTALLDLSHTLAGDYLAQFQYPWEALDGIQNLILTLGPALDPAEYEQRSPGVWVHKTAALAPTAFLGAPCIIGPETEVRHGAFIRGSALVGTGCVVGNSVELKNVILFDGVQGVLSRHGDGAQVGLGAALRRRLDGGIAGLGLLVLRHGGEAGLHLGHGLVESLLRLSPGRDDVAAPVAGFQFLR